MPKRKRLTAQRKEELMSATAYLKSKDIEIGTREIGKVNDVSHNSILKVMSDKKFEKYKNHWKKKLDQQHIQIIDVAGEKLFKQVKEGKLSAYHLIGLIKTLMEHTYPINFGPQVNVSGNQMAVQVIEGDVSYNSKSKQESVPQSGDNGQPTSHNK